MWGKVRNYSAKQGFGFIDSDSGEKFFFHWKSIDKERKYVRVGDRVSFSLSKTDKGLQAINVK